MGWNLKGITAIGNGEDGVRIEGDADGQIEDLFTAGNGGQGLNIVPAPSAKKRRLGRLKAWLFGTATAVAVGIFVAWASHALGWV